LYGNPAMWRRLFLTGIVLGVACRLGAQGFVWTTQIGLSGSPAGDKIAVDSHTNLYVTGRFEGTAHFGSSNLISAGAGDVFLAKYDSGGNFVWAKQAGGTAEDAGSDVAVDANGNVYVVGSFQGTATFDSTSLTSMGSMSIGTVNNLFLAKYSPVGTLIWVRQAGGPGGGAGLGVAVDTLGNVLSTGYYRNFSGWYSLIIDKWNASGTLLWHKEVAGLPNYGFPIEGTSIKADGGENVYVTGEFGTQVTMGTNTLQTESNFGDSAFIAKLDPNGNFLWAEQEVGSDAFDTATSIALDGSTNVLVVGTYHQTITFGTNQLTTPNSEIGNGFVVKCDSNGNYLWTAQTQRRNGGSCSGVAADSGGNVYVTGFVSFAQVFLEKYDPNGNVLWELDPGHDGYANGYGTAVDGSNHVYLTTWTSGNIVFDNLVFTNIGGNDLFISQISEQVPPVFTIQPQTPVTVPAGGNFTFNASTRSVYPVSYQWQFNQTNLPDATNASLSFTNIRFASEGSYELIASNLYGSSASQVASLTVSAPPPPLLFSPGINTNGQFQMNLGGSSGVTFVIETSTNLTDWMPLTNLFNATGNAIFIDSFNTASADAARFYRAHWLP